MQITKNGMTYLVTSILDNHCCEIHCFMDGQKGGWFISTVAKKDIETHTFHGRSLEDAFVNAGKYYLKQEG